MSRYRDPEMLEPAKPSKCSRILHYTWKVITCIFSHITLVSMVVSYCILGAYTFAMLEAENEKEVKRNISRIREEYTQAIWDFTDKLPVLEKNSWIYNVSHFIKNYEDDLLRAMTKDGWDGIEDTETYQWTFAGALFYSIIVITTIGYGHIAPKTHWGKVVTIFYAILGIPLMLLCLSNIGDIMATSFRFLYWKVCCYVCTRKPKKNKRFRSNRGTIRQAGRYSGKSRNASFRRSGRTSTRSADSGFGPSEIAPSSYSDTDIRMHEDPSNNNPPRGSSLPRMRPSQVSRYSDSNAVQQAVPQKIQMRGGSLDRRRLPSKAGNMVVDVDIANRTPVLANKYVLERNIDNRPDPVDGNSRSARRAMSMPRQQQTQYLEPPGNPAEPDGRRGSRRRGHSPPNHPSPSIMSPMGFTVHRQKYYEDDSDQEYFEEGYYNEGGRSRTKPVPIWLCVFLVVSYIFGGAFLFTAWEEWEYLDSAYFCFITLTTIGFGDFVPAKRVAENAEVSIALCSLYLLFGISLLAMSFNLVQEEVIGKVKGVAKTLGIIKNETEDEEEDD